MTSTPTTTTTTTTSALAQSLRRQRQMRRPNPDPGPVHLVPLQAKRPTTRRRPLGSKRDSQAPHTQVPIRLLPASQPASQPARSPASITCRMSPCPSSPLTTGQRAADVVRLGKKLSTGETASNGDAKALDLYPGFYLLSHLF